jgi:restriction system protein
MAIPDYQTLMLPLLRSISDGRESRSREVVAQLASEFSLTVEERSQLLPSGSARLFDNRVGWASFYLKQARLIEKPKRGVLRITRRGLELLAENPPRIDLAILERYPEFVELRGRRASQRQPAETNETAAAAELPRETPNDALANAYTQLRVQLEIELLQQISQASPAFFEQLVVDVLVAMGYGGTRQDAGSAIGQSGDHGIDGIINEDQLGLDVIYLQAKRWESTVGRPEIQKFAGALHEHRARKGVFITTSKFSSEAKDYVSRIDTRIILIDGERLAQLMVDHGVGVTTVGTFHVERIDSDYFSEE